MARTPEAQEWEGHHYTVDSEYAQQGSTGQLKGDDGQLRDREPVSMRPDLILHYRTKTGRVFNWLVCEIKLYESRPQKVAKRDLEKLQKCIQLFGYQTAIWLALPKEADGDQTVYFAEVRDGVDPGPPRPID